MHSRVATNVAVTFARSGPSWGHFALLPTHSLPARSTSCSLVLNTACEALGLGDGHGEWEGEGQGEEAELAKSSSDDWREAGLARRQRGLHHSFCVERCMSFLALCSLRAERRVDKVTLWPECEANRGVCVSVCVLPRARALGLLEETVRVTMR